MTEAQIIADLKSKGYTSAQAYAICKSRMKTKAQSGLAFGNSGIPYADPSMFINKPPMSFIEGELPDFSGIGQNPNYMTPPMNSNLSGYQFTGNDLNLSEKQQDKLINRYNRDNFQAQNTQEVNKTVIDNSYGGVSLENALNYAGRGFGEKDPWKAGIGTSLSLLKGSRNFLSGYGAGKVNREGYEDYIKNLYKDMTPNQAFQSGGKFKNSEVLAMNALTDNPQGNVNAEGGEFVKRTNGMVQPIVGENHVKNGKKADGVDVKLNDGDKVLSDYIKLRPNDIKELKERYKIALKKGDTPAKALAKIEVKIGLKKETDKLAESAEKLEKALKIKDPTSKELSIETLQNIIATQNEKIANLKQVSAVAFDELFEAQEKVEKKDPTKLYDKNGKEVEDEEDDDNMQMGGVYELANKFGISKERAKELVSMQMGGEQQSGQEEQIMQMIMQMLQEGASPEQVVEQLIQQGVPQEQAVQAVQMMMQQSPQEEGMEGQMSNPKEEQMEMAQQGRKGELVYNVTTGRNEYRSNAKVKQSATKDKAYGEPDPEIALQRLYNNFPDIISTQFKDNIDIDELGNVTFKKNIPLNKEQEIVRNFQKQSDARMKASADVILKNPNNFSPEQVKEAQRYREQETFLEKTPGKEDEANSIRGFDAKLGNFTSGRYSMGLDLLTPEDLKLAQSKGIKTLKQLKNSDLYTKLTPSSKSRVDNVAKLVGETDADFSLFEFNNPTNQSNISQEEDQNLQDNNQELEVKNRIKNAMAFLPTDLRLPPSGVPPLLKSEVNLGRIEPIKQTVEPYLANQASQLYTAQEQLSATGLPPQIQQALQAQAFASNQMASNDAISKVEQFNNQQRFQADQFNIAQRAKEDITNEQFAQDYQSKMLASISNTERDYRNYLIEGNLQNRASWKDIENANLLNANVENFSYTPGVGVDYINNRAGDLSKGLPSPTTEQLASWTPEELQAYMRTSDALRKKKLANNQQ